VGLTLVSLAVIALGFLDRCPVPAEARAQERVGGALLRAAGDRLRASRVHHCARVVAREAPVKRPQQVVGDVLPTAVVRHDGCGDEQVSAGRR